MNAAAWLSNPSASQILEAQLVICRDTVSRLTGFGQIENTGRGQSWRRHLFPWTCSTRPFLFCSGREFASPSVTDFVLPTFFLFALFPGQIRLYQTGWLRGIDG